MAPVRAGAKALSPAPPGSPQAGRRPDSAAVLPKTGAPGNSPTQACAPGLTIALTIVAMVVAIAFVLLYPIATTALFLRRSSRGKPGRASGCRVAEQLMPSAFASCATSASPATFPSLSTSTHSLGHR
eukprot:5118916-Pyramimonas_sp.AAC.1